MSTSNLSTLDRIQLEIKESIQREKELKNGFHQTKTEKRIVTNGIDPPKIKPLQESNNTTRPNTNGFKKFSQNTSSTKGVMHKFLRARGRLSNMSSINTTNQNTAWAVSDGFKPAKMTVEKGGRPLRNGFVSAEVKMKRELQDFQERETQLREERKKSQSDLMAALQLEETEFDHFGCSNLNGGLKAAKSMANLNNNNNSDDGFDDNCSSVGGSLKPARSLAELCHVMSDDEGSLPGTHSLIMQFENMQFKNRPSSQSSSKGSFSRDF